MAGEGVVPAILGIHSGESTPSSTPSSIHRSIEGTGRSRFHIQHESNAIGIRSLRDGDDCDGYNPFCVVLSWFSGKGKGHGHPMPSNGHRPGGPIQPTWTSKSFPGSPISTPRSPDPITSSPLPTRPAATTVLSSTPQNPGLPNPPTSNYSSSQSNAIETSTVIVGSNSGGANTSPTSTSDNPPSISTVFLTSIVVSSAKVYPQTPSSSTMPPPPPPPPAFPSPSPGSQLQSPSGPHRWLNTGAIVGIAFGALAAVLCGLLAFFFLLRRRRAQRRARRTSVGSSLQRLEPHSYSDGSSRPVSSVWTWFGSVSVDPDFEPKPEPSPHSLDFKPTEKHAETGHMGGYSPGPSPCPSPARAETQPLARDVPSVHSVHEGRPRLDIPPSALEAPSSSGLLALARTDYAAANPLDHGDRGLERKVSGISRTTATSGDVQSVEAL